MYINPFEYSAADLAKAAAEQCEYRKSRVTAWEAKKAEVMEQIKTSGLTVHEGPADKMSSYSNRGAGGAHIEVDASLQSDLDECTDRLKTHRQAVIDYDGWVQVMSASPTAQRFKLKHMDWLYFFGK